MDVVLSGVALVVVSPLLALAALGIWLSDKGQIFYRARLAGRDGRPFTMYKLRTMRVDHGTFRSVITAEHDPRVFPFGAWLRRAKVDELPQLINILRGEMSIVGPRPEHPRIVDQYYAPEHRRLLQVRPGLVKPRPTGTRWSGARIRSAPMSSACSRCAWRSTSCTWTTRPWRTTSP